MSLEDDTVIDIQDAAVSGDASLKKQKAVALATRLKEINRSYALALYGDGAVILKTDEVPIRYLSADTFKLMMQNNLMHVGGQQAPIKIGPTWLSWEKRRTYEDVVFYPGDASDRNVYNLWRGFAYEPSNEGSCSLFLDHMRVNICNGNEQYYNWLLDWMADAVQKPWRKNWTAVLLESQEEGTGKGIFVRQFGKLFGRHFAAFNKPGQLLGKFNAHLDDKLILFMDEGSLVDKYAYDFVKSLISEPTLQIEPKGRSMREVNSYHRLIVASNDSEIIRASSHDRRWMVLHVGKTCQNNLGYFEALDTQMNCGGYEALMYLLVNRKYHEHTVKTIIKTESLREQKEQNVAPLVDWWRSCLKAGSFGLDGEWPYKILTTDFYKSYLIWCEQMKINKRISNFSITKKLNREIGVSLRSQSSGASCVYELPELSAARAALEDKLGYEIDWDD